MTIEFYKRKSMAQSQAKAIRKFVKRKGIRAVKVRIKDVSLLEKAGGRRIGGRGKYSHSFKAGEVGYIIGFRGMSKVGLRRK